MIRKFVQICPSIHPSHQKIRRTLGVSALHNSRLFARAHPECFCASKNVSKDGVKSWQAIFFGLLLFMCSVYPSSELLNKAHLFFEQKEYAKAQELYEQLQEKDGAVWMQLGHCYFAQDKPLDALICWKRAEKTAYGAAYIAVHTLQEQAEQKLSAREQIGLFMYWMRWCKIYVLAIPTIVWQVIFLFLWYLIFYALVIRKRLHAKKFTFLVGCLLVAAYSLTLQHKLVSSRVAIVKEQEAPLYAGTDERFYKRAVLAQGQHVNIKKTENGWHKVEGPTGSGWVQTNKVEEITT